MPTNINDDFRDNFLISEMCDERDHGPNMAALQTYQTSFATGDLEKIMGVMVSK